MCELVHDEDENIANYSIAWDEIIYRFVGAGNGIKVLGVSLIGFNWSE